MLAVWTEKDDRPVNSVHHDAARLALNIITCAGFGLSYQFRTVVDDLKGGHSMSYGASLMAVMGNITLLVLVPSWVFDLPNLPKSMANFKTAVREFKEYMVDMVDSAKHEAANGESGLPNLLNTLVQNSEMVKSSSKARDGLTDEEIYGNLFIFSFAGHETTANTLTYSIYLLAAFPKWQDWVAEEVWSVCDDLDKPDPPDYQALYPKLSRCLSIMVGSCPIVKNSRVNNQIS
jgi:cytochrome P450